MTHADLVYLQDLEVQVYRHHHVRLLGLDLLVFLADLGHLLNLVDPFHLVHLGDQQILEHLLDRDLLRDHVVQLGLAS